MSSKLLLAEEDGMTYACPHCDIGGAIRIRHNPNLTHAGNPDHPYICDRCGESTAEPVKRKSRAPQNDSLKGAAKALWEMDPEDAGLSPLGSAKPGGSDA